MSAFQAPTGINYEPSEIISKCLRTLNEAYESDPAAIHALLCNRVPCNQSLAQHPTIQVDVNKVATGESYAVGMLGVINGLVEELTGQRIASLWSDDEPGRLLGFTLYLPQGGVAEITKGAAS